MLTCCPGAVEDDTEPYFMSGAGHLIAVKGCEMFAGVLCFNNLISIQKVFNCIVKRLGSWD